MAKLDEYSESWREAAKKEQRCWYKTTKLYDLSFFRL